MPITAERDCTDYSSPAPTPDPAPDRSARGKGRGVADTTAPSLVEFMRTDERQWDRFSCGRPIRRAKRAGFLRNVAVALGDWEVEAALEG